MATNPSSFNDPTSGPMTYVLGSENAVTFTSILSLLNVESALMAYNWGLGDYGASVEGTGFGGAVNAGGITGRVSPSPCATYDPDLAFGVCPTYGTGPGALVLDAQTSENCAAYNISSGDGPDTWCAKNSCVGGEDFVLSHTTAVRWMGLLRRYRLTDANRRSACKPGTTSATSSALPSRRSSCSA